MIGRSVAEIVRVHYLGHPRYLATSGGSRIFQTRCILRVIVRWSSPPNDVVIITRDVLLSTCSTLRHSTRKKGDPQTRTFRWVASGNSGYGLSLPWKSSAYSLLWRYSCLQIRNVELFTSHETAVPKSTCDLCATHCGVQESYVFL